MATSATPSTTAAVLRRRHLDRSPSIGALVAALEGEARPFLLTGRWGLPDGAPPEARTVVASCNPSRVLGASDDPFAAFEATMRLADDHAADGAIGGGWVGWLGYGLSRAVERTLGPQPHRPHALPVTNLAWYDDVLRRAPDGTWWVEALTTDPDDPLDALVARWHARLDGAPDAPRPAALGVLRPRGGGAIAHRAAVAETIERIRAGELFQANVCLQLEGTLSGSLAGLTEAVLARTDPWYGGWIDAGDGRAMLSASPELFLRRRGRDVTTGPIKGTLPRRSDGPTDPADDPTAAALLASAKDHAEHVMIVDLMRNDLGRVCDYGSIRPDLTPTAEPHAGVWHLVSSVRGTLHEGLGDGRLLRATFPPGSVTGAPKVQAMRVIAEVEGVGREVYTGAHGLLSPVSGLDLGVTIRTLEAWGERAWLGVGGGIVADSDPHSELLEAFGKAAAIVAAAGSTVDQGGGLDGSAPTDAPWPPSAASRPDPQRGLIETIAVRRGRPVRLAAHLERLRASAGALSLPLPDDLQRELDTVLASATERELLDARLRIELAPDSPVLVELVPFAAVADGGVPLSAAVVPGGLGPHKWRDRRLLAALAGLLPDGDLPLLLDGDGAVLEAAWANVWWEREDGALCTPALDGRMLPGVTRAALLRAAAPRAVEVAPTPYRAIASVPLLLTSARGVTPAFLGSTPDHARTRATALAAELNALLALGGADERS